jgi:Co/Zn/Cd efflux system component
MSTTMTPRPALSTTYLVIGYVCAVLLPLIGLIMGVRAKKRFTGVGTNHGSVMITVSVIAWVANILIVVASSSGA